MLWKEYYIWNQKYFETEFGGRKLVVEVGEVAKQTNASALIHYGGTTVLSVVVNKKKCQQVIFSH